MQTEVPRCAVVASFPRPVYESSFWTSKVVVGRYTENQTDTARFRNTRTDDRTDLKKTPKTDSDKLPTPTHP